MVSYNKLSENQRNQAIGMRLTGQEFTQIAEHFGCSERTIHRLWLKYSSTGQRRDLPRSGRPQITDLRQKRRIIRTHKMHTFISA